MTSASASLTNEIVIFIAGKLPDVKKLLFTLAFHLDVCFNIILASLLVIGRSSCASVMVVICQQPPKKLYFFNIVLLLLQRRKAL